MIQICLIAFNKKYRCTPKNRKVRNIFVSGHNTSDVLENPPLAKTYVVCGKKHKWCGVTDLELSQHSKLLMGLIQDSGEWNQSQV